MNEELYEKLIQQIEDKMELIINECLRDPSKHLLDLPFTELSEMNELRCMFDNEMFDTDLESHPKLVNAFKQGVDLGEIFWETVSWDDCFYCFIRDDSEFDRFLDDAEKTYRSGWWPKH